MKTFVAAVVLGAILFGAIPAFAAEADVEGVTTERRVLWPLIARYDVRYPGTILILDVPEGADVAQ